MGGVIALSLTACSSDSVFEEQNTDEELPMTTNSFNNNNSGQYGPNPTPNFYGKNYISPWDIWYRKSIVNGQQDLQPFYYFTNGNMEDVTPYDIRAFAYAGLAYFDSDNDGTYNDPKKLQDTGNGFVAALNNGNYPNLYAPLSNPQEVGNLIRIPVPIDVPAYPNPNSSFRIEDKINHLPVIGATNAAPKYTTPYSGFNFGGTITPQERDLLANYGKIFFYEVHVYNKVTGALVLSTMMHPKIQTLPNGITLPSDVDPGWKPVTDLSGTNHLTGNVPGFGNFPLYYFNANISGGTQWDFSASYNVNKCDSREVVFDVPAAVAPYEVQIDPVFKVTLDFFATGHTGWVNSALYLNLHSK
ncbi:hypothetical protein NU10_01640 [Flavobacterium dauae]|uniref:hypothetical protein n=1 Tax=Flavobacterium dauae TaxID=1563479 RepID=UPI00101B2CB2|nr:hypothetical protein [Flavobacterium dauae]WLD24123.1 hypothetical protein NU10_01640 [Flavobacterium dauae]